jgi:hypothetical protein
MASGEMTEDEFAAFLTTVLKQVRARSRDGAITFVCIDWRHLYELLVAGRAAKLALKNLCVWAKTNAGMGTFYRSQHELVAAFKVGTASHSNSFELGQYGRHRTNVWTYPGVNSFGAGRDQALAMHPTVKPVALVADAIKDCSKRNGLILDPLLGSGTTVIAAELTGRRAAGFELDPRYVDGRRHLDSLLALLLYWRGHGNLRVRLVGPEDVSGNQPETLVDGGLALAPDLGLSGNHRAVFSDLDQALRTGHRVLCGPTAAAAKRSAMPPAKPQ